MCVGEKDREEQWLKVLRWIESEEVGNKSEQQKGEVEKAVERQCLVISAVVI